MGSREVLLAAVSLPAGALCAGRAAKLSVVSLYLPFVGVLSLRPALRAVIPNSPRGCGDRSSTQKLSPSNNVPPLEDSGGRRGGKFLRGYGMCLICVCALQCIKTGRCNSGRWEFFIAPPPNLLG